jgi:hypothetical protein
MISFLLPPRLLAGEFSLFALDSNFIPLGTSVHAHFALAPGEWDEPGGDAPIAFFYLDYDNVGLVTMTNVGTDGSWGADYTYSSPEYPGTYTLGAEVPSSLDDSWDSEDATWAIIMGWSKDEVRPGVGKSETVLLYVDPASACSSVTISTGGIVTASPGTPGGSPATVTVTGVTPSTVQYDDAVEASTPDGEAVFLPAVATVPTSFAEDSPSPGTMTGNPSTDVITWEADVTITISDQFGTTLDASWAGSSVYEIIMDPTFTTNIFMGAFTNTLSSTGTVPDPVKYVTDSLPATVYSNIIAGTPPASRSDFTNVYQRISMTNSTNPSGWLNGKNTRTKNLLSNALSVGDSVSY